MDNQEFIQEFLEESAENLDQLDQDLVALEENPDDEGRIASIFRTVHTIKGNSGFFNFSKLGAVAHVGETLLGRLRDGELRLNADMASVLLDLVDAFRQLLGEIAASGQEGDVDYRELSERLTRLAMSPAETDDVAGKVAEVASGTIEQPAADHEAPTDQPTAASESGAAAGDTDRPEPRPRPEASVRVDIGTLDRLMDLAGELVLTRNQLERPASERGEALQQLRGISRDLQEGLTRTRMQPIANVLGKLPRVVRDLAHSCGKVATVRLEGTETELDRSLLDAIRDPITHLVRNAVDHGLEPPDEREQLGKPRSGEIVVAAYQQGSTIIVDVTDDGRGIDPERLRTKAVERGWYSADEAASLGNDETLQLIFRPGFSTAEQVTDVSGRGVGMDVVKTNLERSGGSVHIESSPGLGTNVCLRIPLTLAIVPAVLVNSAAGRFAIPHGHIRELMGVTGSEVAATFDAVLDAQVLRVRDELVPVVALDNLLEVPQPPAPTDRDGQASDAATRNDYRVVVLQSEQQAFGLVVHEIESSDEIVVKPLDRRIESLGVYSGATILGDGSLVLILDIPGLADRAGLRKIQTVASRSDESQPTEVARQDDFVLCGLDDHQWLAVKLDEVTRLVSYQPEDIQRTGERSLLSWEGRMLPLVDVDQVIPSCRSPEPRPRRQVVVHQRGEQCVGLQVPEVVDIVRGDGEWLPLTEPGVLGSTVIDGRSANVLDVDQVFRSVGWSP